MQLVLDTKGLILSKKGQTFQVLKEEKQRIISPAKLSSIAVTANIVIHSEAIVLAIKNRIPILFFDRIGKAKARLWSPYFESLATLRRQQVKFAESIDGSSWMVDLFQLKTSAQIAHLKYLKSKRSGLSLGLGQAIQRIRLNAHQFEAFREALPNEVQQQMMGVEGNIARLYWQQLGSHLPAVYRFKQRSRRPSKDIYNAALNYLYGMLYSVVESGIFAAGLDPYLGILHADMHKKPTLAFDLIEPFRPWMDQMLTDWCLEKTLKKEYFSKNQFGIFLNKYGKAFIIPKFNELMREKRDFLGQEASTRNQIYFLAGRLAQRIRSIN